MKKNIYYKQIFNRIPPQATDIEEAILGAMMIDKKKLSDVIDVILPDIFYSPVNKEIFKAIRNLFYSSEPIDLITVSNYLRKKGKLQFVGGDYYLVELTQKVLSSSHIEHHTKIVQQKFILRNLIQTFSDLIDKSYDESIDVLELLSLTEAKLFEVSNFYIRKNYKTSNYLINKTIKMIKEVQFSKNGLSGIPSGFHELDNITSGWQNSDLIILAGRPGMGKTAFTLSMARNIIVNNKIPLVFFSLEMSSTQLITRLISFETGISSDELRKGKLSNDQWKKINTKTEVFKNSLLFIDDTPNLSILDLKIKCRRLVFKHKVKLIIIDYLQLMMANLNNKYINREQEISIISRNLKSMAKELNVPIIALSQLSRAVEIRGGNKKPLLSDLRESGAIEQDADIVGFIYRPDYYGFNNWNQSYNMSSCQGQAEVIIAKHRNGSLGKIRLRFLKSQAKFINFF